MTENCTKLCFHHLWHVIRRHCIEIFNKFSLNDYVYICIYIYFFLILLYIVSVCNRLTPLFHLQLPCGVLWTSTRVLHNQMISKTKHLNLWHMVPNTVYHMVKRAFDAIFTVQLTTKEFLPLIICNNILIFLFHLFIFILLHILPLSDEKIHVFIVAPDSMD